MKGLNLGAFLKKAIFRGKVKAGHLEGPFYYPGMGIGTITEKLAGFCGRGNIIRNSEITKILHNGTRVQAVEVNGNERIDIDEVVSTLPLALFLQMMDPTPPEEILLLAKALRYRNVILVALFLNRESVTEAATVYFPDHDFPFTRICEPKNRSIYMSPPGQTSLVAEIPCQPGDGLWCAKGDRLIQLVRSRLVQIGWIKEEEIIDASVNRMNWGYPILEIGFQEKIQRINAFLNGFSNLKLSGRNGRFVYAWIHNTIRYGKNIIEEYMPSQE